MSAGILAYTQAEFHQVARSQLDKVTAAAHARQRATFNPQTASTEIAKTSLPPKPKRRVSLGTVVDAETGELMISGKRHSQRSHTVLNTSTSDALFKVELKKKVRCCGNEYSGNNFHISRYDIGCCTEEGQDKDHASYTS